MGKNKKNGTRSEGACVTELDIVVPVYNEGRNIASVLEMFGEKIHTNFRVLLCYDQESDDTLPVVRRMLNRLKFGVVFVKNDVPGVHGAVVKGFTESTAPAVLVYPADDNLNAGIVDQMMEQFRKGNDIVVASRFMKGGSMKNCPWPKSFLVRAASFTLYWLGGIPVQDASNGFRLFSRRILNRVMIESTHGFTFSLELLVKCHRFGWSIGEVPAIWHERVHGKSRFQLLRWLPEYLRWYLFAFGTTYLKHSPESIKMKEQDKQRAVDAGNDNRPFTKTGEFVGR